MSQTTFAEQYSAYRDSQGFSGGVDMEIRVDGVTEAERQLLEQIGNVYSSSLSKILSATKAGVKSGKMTTDEAFNLLKKLNIKLLAKEDNANAYSAAFVGGMRENMDMYGNLESDNNMKAAAEFFFNSAEFVGGVSKNITKELIDAIILYRIYMNLIQESLFSLKNKKNCDELKSGLGELSGKLSEVTKLSQTIMSSLGTEGANYAKELEKAFDVKDMDKMKELLKSSSNKKELMKLLSIVARLQAPTLYYSKELTKALNELDIKKEQINKIRNNRELDSFIDDYLMSSKAKGKNIKKTMKQIAKVRDLLNRKFMDKNALEYNGADNDYNDGIDEYSGAADDVNNKYSPKCGCTKYVGQGYDDLFSGGEFEELNQEVQLKLGYADVISSLEPQKKKFIEKNNEFIDEMMIAAKEAAYDFHKSNKYTDTDVLFFIRRLMMLRNINSDEMKVFYTTGVEYNTRYIRDEYIARLRDLMEASKAIESKIGAKQKVFTDVLSKYISFLTEWDKVQSNAKYSGAKDEFRCSGINNMSVYDKYEGAADFIYGGLVGKTFDQIVGVFAKSIALGRLQNGMNITIDEVKKYSKEQDNINEKIISKKINNVNVVIKTTFDSIAEDNKNFPIPKALAGQVLRDNFNGYRNLMYAAQALDKKIRTYHLKVIENPLAVNDLVTLMKKVVVDMNWITDMDFTDLKEFNKYFHVESVADINNVIADNTFAVRRDNANAVEVAAADGPNSEVNNYRKNAYLQQNGLSPFPVTTNTLYKSHVSTLIAATHPDVAHDIESIVAEKQTFKVGTDRYNRNVNLYYGKSVFPAKFISAFDNAGNYDKTVTQLNKDIIKGGNNVGTAGGGNYTVGQEHLKNIQNPIGITNAIKFIDPLKIERFYRSAQASLRKGVDTILKIRDIMSVFDKIDKSYAKNANDEKDGEKIGKIYNAIKEYLVLSSMYPIIYNAGQANKHYCGFIAKRDFGHPAISIGASGETHNMLTNNIELMGDINRISLAEYYNNEYSDARSRTYNLGNPFPAANAKDGNNPLIRDNTGELYAKYGHNPSTIIPLIFKEGDIMLVMMIKSMYTKIMSIIAMYTNMNMIGSPASNLPFNQLRTIYGGQVENIFNSPPNIVAENAELYVRMLYYMLFYKKLFFEEEYNVNIKNLITGAKRMALLPINDGKYTGIMKLVFLKWFEYNTSDANFLTRITDMDISTFVNECNNIMDATSGANTKAKTIKIMQELVTDINQRYGLVSTDDILKLMRDDRSKTYPQLNAINSRYTGNEPNYRAKVTRKTKPILDGEEEGYDIDVPSKAKEYTNTGFGTSVSLLDIKNDYKFIDHLASIQNFRKKLDEMTEGLNTRFNNYSADPNITQLNNSGLFVLIRSLEYKLKNQSMVMDKLRIIKEYLFTQTDRLVYDISREIMIYRELVITPCNLLFKLYVRIIAMINIHGKDQIFVDPLLRNTMLYYLDSVNTNLVTVANTGGSPMLDFSNLEATCQMYLDQVRAYHMQTRSGINEGFGKKMENVINFLYNTHRAIFMDQGLISKIQYEDSQHQGPNINGGAQYTDPGVRMNPLVDYSEYLHLTRINTNSEGQNSFIIDQGIYGLPNRPVVTVKDPRLFVSQSKDLRYDPELEFELLSFEFSPKNIYVLFEYLLVMIYKAFCEPYGKIYTPLMERFVQSFEPIIGNIDINDLSMMLNQEERFRGDMPFSDKTMFLYKALYKFTDKTVAATENDITKLSKEQVNRMSQNLPLFMFLFKFIVKQAAVHNHMLLNERSYLANSGNALIVSMNAGLAHGVGVGAGRIYANLPEGDTLAPILGGKVTVTKAKNIISNSNIFKGMLSGFKNDILLGYKTNLDDLKLYRYVNSGIGSNLNFNQKSGLLLSGEFLNDKKFDVSNKDFVTNIDNLIKLFDDLPKISASDSKSIINKVDSVSKGLTDVNKQLINLSPDAINKNTAEYFETIVNSNEIYRDYPIIMKFIDKYIETFGKIDTLITNEIPDLYDKNCYQNYLVPNGIARVNAAGTFPIKVAAVNKDLKNFIAGYGNAAGGGVGNIDPALVFALNSEYDLTGSANINAGLAIQNAKNIVDDAANPSYDAEFNLIATPGVVTDNGVYCGPVHNAQYVVSDDDNTLQLPIFTDDLIYNQSFTNIISVLEGIPSSFIPENCAPALDQTPEHMGLFADCFTSYQYYINSNQPNKIEDFDLYIEEFINEKVNMIFMKGFDEFFGFFFKFIDCRYAGDNLAAQFIRYYLNARLQDAKAKSIIDVGYTPGNALGVGAAGVPAGLTFDNTTPEDFINLIYTMTHDGAGHATAANVAGVAYLNSDENHLATLYKASIANADGGTGAGTGTIANGTAFTQVNLATLTTSIDPGDTNAFIAYNVDDKPHHDSASAAYIGSMPFQSYSSIGKFYPYYGTYDKNNIYNIEYYIGNNFKTIDPRYYFYRLLTSISKRFQTSTFGDAGAMDNFMIPNGMPTTSADVLSIEEIQKFILPRCLDNATYKAIFGEARNRIFTDIDANDVPTLLPNVYFDRLYNWIRDIGYFILGTNAASLEDKYNAVKNAVRTKLREHYITNKNYLPILRVNNTPFLATGITGVSFKYNDPAIHPIARKISGHADYNVLVSNLNIYQYYVKLNINTDATAVVFGYIKSVSTLISKNERRDTTLEKCLISFNYKNENARILELLQSVVKYYDGTGNIYNNQTSLIGGAPVSIQNYIDDIVNINYSGEAIATIHNTKTTAHNAHNGLGLNSYFTDANINANNNVGYDLTNAAVSSGGGFEGVDRDILINNLGDEIYNYEHKPKILYNLVDPDIVKNVALFDTILYHKKLIGLLTNNNSCNLIGAASNSPIHLNIYHIVASCVDINLLKLLYHGLNLNTIGITLLNDNKDASIAGGGKIGKFELNATNTFYDPGAIAAHSHFKSMFFQIVKQYLQDNKLISYVKKIIDNCIDLSAGNADAKLEAAKLGYDKFPIKYIITYLKTKYNDTVEPQLFNLNSYAITNNPAAVRILPHTNLRHFRSFKKLIKSKFVQATNADLILMVNSIASDAAFSGAKYRTSPTGVVLGSGTSVRNMLAAANGGGGRGSIGIAFSNNIVDIAEINSNEEIKTALMRFIYIAKLHFAGTAAPINNAIDNKNINWAADASGNNKLHYKDNLDSALKFVKYFDRYDENIKESFKDLNEESNIISGLDKNVPTLRFSKITNFDVNKLMIKAILLNKPASSGFNTYETIRALYSGKAYINACLMRYIKDNYNINVKKYFNMCNYGIITNNPIKTDSLDANIVASITAINAAAANAVAIGSSVKGTVYNAVAAGTFVPGVPTRFVKQYSNTAREAINARMVIGKLYNNIFVSINKIKKLYETFDFVPKKDKLVSNIEPIRTKNIAEIGSENIPSLGGQVPEIEIISYNSRALILEDGTTALNPTYSDLCMGCGSPCKYNDLVGRAKNAMKFGTIVYKCLSDVYAEIGKIPQYLETNPYLKDIQSLISSKEIMHPTTFAIDAIPAIINTYIVNGNVVDEANILTNPNIGDRRKPFGLHCNNIRDLNEMLLGSKNSALVGMMPFLMDDKIQKLTAADFPWTKSLVGETDKSSDIVTNVDTGKLNTFLQNFGTLTKYLYEIEMKEAFADMFPVFNSLANPKFQIRTIVNPAANPIFGLFMSLYDKENINLRGIRNSLPTVLQFKGLPGGENIRYRGNNIPSENASYLHLVNMYKGYGSNPADPHNILNAPAGAVDPTATTLLNERYAIDIDNLLPIIEMNTNLNSVRQRFSDNGNLSKQNNVPYARRQTAEIISTNMVENIIDIGIFPINIHAMMREIPLANTINNNYSFDKIADWITKSTVDGADKFTSTNSVNINILTRVIGAGDRTKAPENVQYNDALAQSDKNFNDIYRLYTRNLLKNPTNLQMVPIDISPAPATAVTILSAIAHRLSLNKMIKKLPDSRIITNEMSTGNASDNMFAIQNTAATQINSINNANVLSFRDFTNSNVNVINAESILDIRHAGMPANESVNIKTNYLTSAIDPTAAAAANATPTPFQFNGYACYYVDPLGQRTGAAAGHIDCSYAMLSNPDLAILAYNGNNYCSSQLVKKLLGTINMSYQNVNANGAPGAISLLNDANSRLLYGERPSDINSYYYDQMSYLPRSYDVVSGVDKNLASPILAVNIYAEVIFNMFTKKIRELFTNSDYDTPDTTQTGVISVFAPMLASE